MQHIPHAMCIDMAPRTMIRVDLVGGNGGNRRGVLAWCVVRGWRSLTMRNTSQPARHFSQPGMEICETKRSLCRRGIRPVHRVCSGNITLLHPALDALWNHIRSGCELDGNLISPAPTPRGQRGQIPINKRSAASPQAIGSKAADSHITVHVP